MIEMAVRIDGLDEVALRFREAPQKLHGAMVGGMKRATQLVVAQAKRNASGRPGPRVQTGRLRSSIAGEVHEGGSAVKGMVGTNVKYAPYLELGTRKMPAYPYLQPAISSPYMQQVIAQTLREAVLKAMVTE